jgi:hypothetical protein
MKISSILRDFLAYWTDHVDAPCAAWTDDPYAHPDISAMSERERADLPPTHMPAPRHVLRGGTPSGTLGNTLATCT